MVSGRARRCQVDAVGVVEFVEFNFVSPRLAYSHLRGQTFWVCLQGCFVMVSTFKSLGFEQSRLSSTMWVGLTHPLMAKD